jgi:hypothetical protein
MTPGDWWGGPPGPQPAPWPASREEGVGRGPGVRPGVRPTRNASCKILGWFEKSKLNAQSELDRARRSKLSTKHTEVRGSLQRQRRVHELDVIQSVDQIASKNG